MTQTISINQLPALGALWEGGRFAGIATNRDGKHCAVVLLPEQGAQMDWPRATAWAASLGGTLPTPPVAALLFATLKDHLRPRWHWTSEQVEADASYAWDCYFDDGYQDYTHKSFEGSAVAVRLIQITA